MSFKGKSIYKVKMLIPKGDGLYVLLLLNKIKITMGSDRRWRYDYGNEKYERRKNG